MTTTSWGRTLVWSLIAAAFIGPGTVATATRAGAEGGIGYLVVIALAAVAGYVFMEMAARITIVSGRSLGALLRQRGRWLPALVFVAIFFGCAAYQAGNLLGALGGLQLLSPLSVYYLLPLAGAVAVVLWSGNPRRIARPLAYLVVAMGLLFVCGAVVVLAGYRGRGGGAANFDSSLVLGLVGTTIVPYNFLLAAGLGSLSGLADMRRGLTLSFGVGSLITAAVLIVGTSTASFTSFADLSRTVAEVLGSYGNLVLGIGLFAAGFSSATTAPLAAAVAARELLDEQLSDRWFRTVWLAVLLTGLLVGFFGVDIIGVILTAQIVNGLLLPLIALVVLLLANSRELLGERVNGRWQNGAGTLVLCFLMYKTGQFLLGLV